MFIHGVLLNVVKLVEYFQLHLTKNNLKSHPNTDGGSIGPPSLWFLDKVGNYYYYKFINKYINNIFKKSTEKKN